MQTVDPPPKTRAWLTRPLDTFHRSYWTGDEFLAAPVGVGDLWDLFDAGGVLRVSHCRGEVISFRKLDWVKTNGEERDRARIPDGGHAAQASGGGADHDQVGHESRLGSPSGPQVSERSEGGSGSAAGCPFDPNVELQLLTREPTRSTAPRRAESARRPFSWSDLPKRPEGDSAPIIYGTSSTPASWVPSTGHDRLAEWVGWQIAGYGIQVGDRVVFCAMAPGSTAWRFYVDLDRGEWQAWGGAWQPLRGEIRICSTGEYPEPDASWSLDQLRGLRTVRDSDGTVCGRSGPDRAEDLATWQAWMKRVNEFAASLEVQA